MEIKDKEGNVRIKFSSFKKQNGDQPVFIDVLIETAIKNVTMREAVTIEFSDLNEFVRNLKKLNDTLKPTFFFQHIDDQL
jgi:hypothetical protein